jgi:hypothetical protein
VSVGVITYVQCDNCHRVGPTADGRAANRPEARQNARVLGWTTKGRRDLCPTCTAKEAA